MSAAWIVALVIMGVGCEIVGVVFGVAEIKSSRRAAIALSESVRKVYLAGNIRVTVAVTGSANLTAAPGRELTEAEKNKQRLDAHETQIAALRGELAKSELRLEERWKSDLKAIAGANEQTTSEMRAALKDFGDDLARGAWRRYSAVGLLVLGAALQALAAVAGTLCAPPA